ncbi:GNAT family N-acetyltransferase [Paraburkholderia fungorum]|uniref:GCN5 family acetyltransferase n=1 Tax=Paraburkholderia fungorum TaxID=134537 RepID=A0A3R7HEC7_9BURK|nr:GNAT family N-acetyltransferase [Paraburkholderia fungorum]RKF38238.1 GCN5 family acetyltransferase [Paraburkholderia fungorum]
MADNHNKSLDIRRLSSAEWVQAFPVIAQLRSLDQAEFLKRARLQADSGYELVGAFQGDTLIGVMGMRPVHTLARGPHLHVDDLVVDAAIRGSGAGRALMEYAEAHARARDMTAVFLDARPDAVLFYERQNYALHPAPSMKKVISSS